MFSLSSNEGCKGLQTLDIRTALWLDTRTSAPEATLMPVATEGGCGKEGGKPTCLLQQKDSAHSCPSSTVRTTIPTIQFHVGWGEWET